MVLLNYTKADFHFERGTTAITGENGAGKTTILEAIAWALFDSLEYNKEDFLRRGAKKGSVRVTFESDLDERRYLVFRDTATGYYLFDPVLGIRLAEKKVDVSAFLRKLLGVEPGTDVRSLFRSAIGVPQGTFTAEFLLPSAARRVAFDRLLKVEEYRDGAERLRDTVNLLRERLTEIREQIATAEGQLKRYDDHRVELGQAKERAELLSSKLLATTNQIEVSSKVVTELDVAATTLNEAQSRLSRLEIERDAVLRSGPPANIEMQPKPWNRQCGHGTQLTNLPDLSANRSQSKRSASVCAKHVRKPLANGHGWRAWKLNWKNSESH